jgi:hypothetical protein
MSKIQQIGKTDVPVIGRFTLKVNKNPKKFRITNINSFVPNGKTVEERVQFKNNSGLVDYVMVDKLITTLNPDKNDIDYHNVRVLIQHPDVGLASINEDAYNKLVKDNLKNANPTFTLTNIDKYEDDKHNESIGLLKTRYKIYDDKNPISKKQLIYICSYLGVPHRTDISDEKRFIIFLQKQLDKYIQQGEEQINSFNEITDNIQSAEKVYYVNEFIRLGIVTEKGGIYKVKELPVGPDVKSVINYFDQNPEAFTLYKKIVIEDTEGTIYQ